MTPALPEGLPNAPTGFLPTLPDGFHWEDRGLAYHSQGRVGQFVLVHRFDTRGDYITATTAEGATNLRVYEAVRASDVAPEMTLGPVMACTMCAPGGTEETAPGFVHECAVKCGLVTDWVCDGKGNCQKILAPAEPSLATPPSPDAGPKSYSPFDDPPEYHESIAGGRVEPAREGETPDGSIRNRIVKVLRETTYCCTRVWSAWSYGTMTEDDFHPAWEDEDVLNDLEALYDTILQRAEAAERSKIALLIDRERVNNAKEAAERRAADVSASLEDWLSYMESEAQRVDERVKGCWGESGQLMKPVFREWAESCRRYVGVLKEGLKEALAAKEATPTTEGDE